MEFPSYIPQSVAQTGDKFVWKGDLFHIGKLEGATPLMAKFGDINSCGCFVLAAGLVTWNVARFSELVDAKDIKSLTDLSEGALAFMCNPKLLSYKSLEGKKVPGKGPKILSAFRTVRRLAIMCLGPGRYLDNAIPPMVDLYHLAYLTRYLLARKDQKAFDAWIDKTTKRIRKVSKRPRHKSRVLKSPYTKAQMQSYVAYYWGLPVPLRLLEEDVAVSNLEKLFTEEIKAIDWKKNQFVARAPSFKSAYGHKA